MSLIPVQPNINAGVDTGEVLHRLKRIKVLSGLGVMQYDPETGTYYDDGTVSMEPVTPTATGPAATIADVCAQGDLPSCQAAIDYYSTSTPSTPAPQQDINRLLNAYQTAQTKTTTPATQNATTTALVNALNSWAKTGQQVLLQQNLPRGIYMSQGTSGTVYYSQPTGSSSIPIANVSGTITASTGTSNTLMIVGIGVLALMVFMSMSKR